VFRAVKYPGLVQLVTEENFEFTVYDLLADLTRKHARKDLLARQYTRLMELAGRQVDWEKAPVKILVINNADLFIWNSNYTAFNKALQTLNMVNVAEKLKPYNGPSNIENLLVYDPDLIVIYFSSKLTVADIYNDPKLRGLKAVVNRQVYRMPLGVARMSGPVERPLLFMWLCQLAHPKLPHRYDIKAMLSDVYWNVYGYRLTENEIDFIFHAAENSQSAGYATWGYGRSH
jgi:ABC-type Fe3+-hydroxamate transport system, periplasmic component